MNLQGRGSTMRAQRERFPYRSTHFMSDLWPPISSVFSLIALLGCTLIKDNQDLSLRYMHNLPFPLLVSYPSQKASHWLKHWIVRCLYLLESHPCSLYLYLQVSLNGLRWCGQLHQQFPLFWMYLVLKIFVQIRNFGEL